MKCAKRHNYLFKCKDCGQTSNHKDAECWKHGYCGRCYRKINSPRKYIPQYKLCNCGEILVVLRYSKRGVNVNTGNYVCTTCSKTFIFNNKYSVVMRGLCHKCNESNKETTIGIDGNPICEDCKKTL
jgi:hypothetical protein